MVVCCDLLCWVGLVCSVDAVCCLGRAFWWVWVAPYVGGCCWTLVDLLCVNVRLLVYLCGLALRLGFGIVTDCDGLAGVNAVDCDAFGCCGVVLVCSVCCSGWIGLFVGWWFWRYVVLLYFVSL